MYRALTCFSGLVSAVAGQVLDIPQKWIAQDLLDAGYIEEISPEQETPKATPKAKTTRAKKTPKGG